MDEVDKALPPLIPGIQETIEAGEAVEEKAEEVIEFFEDTTSKAKDLFEKVEDALEEFGKEREEQLADLQAAIDDLEATAMEKLETEIEAAASWSRTPSASPRRRWTNLRDLMSEELDEVKEGREAFSDALDAVGQMVGQGKNKLTRGADTRPRTRRTTSRTSSARPRTSLTDHINNLSSKMTDLQEEASSRIDQMLQTTNSNQQSLDGGLQGILQDIIQTQVQEMTQEMTAKVSNELKDLLDGRWRR
jgi:uncharacterized phage infection (PIP) family protein YhgE